MTGMISLGHWVLPLLAHPIPSNPVCNRVWAARGKRLLSVQTVKLTPEEMGLFRHRGVSSLHFILVKQTVTEAYYWKGILRSLNKANLDQRLHSSSMHRRRATQDLWTPYYDYHTVLWWSSPPISSLTNANVRALDVTMLVMTIDDQGVSWKCRSLGKCAHYFCNSRYVRSISATSRAGQTLACEHTFWWLQSFQLRLHWKLFEHHMMKWMVWMERPFRFV